MDDYEPKSTSPLLSEVTDKFSLLDPLSLRDDDSLIQHNVKEWHSNKEARGLLFFNFAIGPSLMSQVFLSSALMYLAKEEAGCDTDNDDECTRRVYGFLKPSSLFTFMVSMVCILNVLVLPFLGAIMDFTPHRKLVGMISSSIYCMIQVTQIGTVQSTWLAMFILQAFAYFISSMMSLSLNSYLPEIGRVLGESEMNKFLTLNTLLQFSVEAVYLTVIIAIILIFNLDDVKSGQVSQSIQSYIIIAGFYVCWKMLPSIPPKHKLPSDKNIFLAGFIQNLNTVNGINVHYKDGLRWIILAECFNSSGVNSFAVVAISYLNDTLDMSSDEVGIIFFIVLVSAAPGAYFGSFITESTNPILSYTYVLAILLTLILAASCTLGSPEDKNLAFFFAAFWGICLGWYYPTASLLHCLAIPKDQESELMGFIYCLHSCVKWAPSLIYTIINESELNERWGFASLSLFILIGLGFVQCISQPWDDIVRDGQARSKMIIGFQQQQQ